MMNPTERFSNRVENYVKYRPHYPREIIALLQKECGLTSDSVVADVGSGTGISAKLFLEVGCSVLGIEPNREMRHAGEHLLRSFPNFRSMDGTAEDTGLENSSADFVVAGQAFHWFDRKSAHEEFRRILKPNGRVVLIWNDRRTDSTPFLTDYERLLQTHGTDYSKVDHKRIDQQVIKSFFAPNEFCFSTFPNTQRFDFEGLKGRLLSSSYVPDDGKRLGEMLCDLRRIFDGHQHEGTVTFDYDTLVYFGKLDAR